MCKLMDQSDSRMGSINYPAERMGLGGSIKPLSLTALGYRRSAPKLDKRRTGAWGTLILNANVSPCAVGKARFRGGEDATPKRVQDP